MVAGKPSDKREKTIGKLDHNTRTQREALIIDQYGGIFPVYEAFYIHSILYSAERSISAFERYESAVTNSKSPVLIIANVQEALTHAGAVSRYFWPMKKDNHLAKARGKRLRDAFQLNDTSPLRWRKLRNSFEHFDEDLDQFLLFDRSGYFYPNPVVGHLSLADQPTDNIFRLVDPENGVCVVLGEKFEFHPVRDEVKRILTRALEMDIQGCRL